MSITADDTISLDTALAQSAAGTPPLPGVVAMVADKEKVLYSGAVGPRSTSTTEPLAQDSVLTIFSATKAVALVAILQLVESGELDLDAPAARYAPEIGSLKVLEGIDDAAPRLRDPHQPVTTRMLLSHTSGLGYPNFNHKLQTLLQSGAISSPAEETLASLQPPLLFEPGTQWEYGLGLDWAGLVVERIAGLRLDEVLRSRVLDPLEMTSSSFVISDDMKARFAPLSTRLPDGGLMELDYVLPQEPEVFMSGQALYSTTEDYARLLRMWLDDGRASDGTQLLSPETVAVAFAPSVQGAWLHPLPSADPFMNLDIDYFPESRRSWSFLGIRNEEDLPTGRRAGSVMWVGLANTYYWIDPVSGITGFWAGNTMPLGDEASWDAFQRFERAVYDSLK